MADTPIDPNGTIDEETHDTPAQEVVAPIDPNGIIDEETHNTPAQEVVAPIDPVQN